MTATRLRTCFVVGYRSSGRARFLRMDTGGPRFVSKKEYATKFLTRLDALSVGEYVIHKEIGKVSTIGVKDCQIQ